MIVNPATFSRFELQLDTAQDGGEQGEVETTLDGIKRTVRADRYDNGEIHVRGLLAEKPQLPVILVHLKGQEWLVNSVSGAKIK